MNDFIRKYNIIQDETRFNKGHLRSNELLTNSSQSISNTFGEKIENYR
jgi:hypothetical protein